MKQVVLIVLVSLFSFSVFGQETEEDTLSKTSFIIGTSGTQITGDGLVGIRKLGPYVGISRMVETHSNLNLEIGLIYTQKGTRKVPDPASGDYSQYTINLHYIEAPFLFSGKGNKVKKEYGIAVAYLFRQAEKNIVGSLPITNPVRKFDFSAIFGFETTVFQKYSGGLRISSSFIPIRPKRQQSKGIALFPYELNTMASLYLRLRQKKKQ